MSVALPTFQEDKSWLKDAAPANRSAKCEIWEVSALARRWHAGDNGDVNDEDDAEFGSVSVVVVVVVVVFQTRHFESSVPFWLHSEQPPRHSAIASWSSHFERAKNTAEVVV